MPDHEVSWDIDLEADNPADAALQALAIQRDPNSVATIFKITDEHGQVWMIDVEDPEEPVYLSRPTYVIRPPL